MRHLLWSLAVALCSCLVPGQIRRVELSSTVNGEEILQGLIPSPEPMNARELGAWQLLCSGMLEGNDNFVKEDIFAFGGQTGIPPRLSWSNEALSIQFTAPKGGESTIARLLESVIANPKLDDERLGELRARLSTPLADDWSAALAGERGDTVIPSEFVRRFAARAIRPENLILVGTPGALRAMDGRFSDWKPIHVPPDIRVTNSLTFRGPETSKTGVLVGATFKPITSQAATCLAIVALGGGKTALFHQVLREQRGWTYRQEAFLKPERSGWRPTLVLQSSEPIPPKAELTGALLEKVDTLSADDLQRFKTLTSTALAGNNPLSPFRFPDVYAGTSQDRATWLAYATLWGTPNTTPESLLADVKRATLDELKEELKKILGQLMVVH